MHRPGYVQGGQEAGFGYLLLEVYYRKIPGSTGMYFSKKVRQSSRNLKSSIFWSPVCLSKKSASKLFIREIIELNGS
jgi:hypothetical protein